MKLAVTTLGCPEWTLSQILSRVKEYGYDAIELRGLGPDLDLTQSPAFSNPSAIAQTRLDFNNAGLTICGIDSSASFATANSADRANSLDHAKKTMDLALALGAPFVRVFGGAIPDGETRDIGVGRVVENLTALGEYAVSAGGGVDVVLETHDAFSTGAQVVEALAQVAHPNVAALWDLHHPYRQGESAANTYNTLKPYTRLTHVKDSKADTGYCLLGEGDIPIKEMVTLLKRGGYSGYLSLEWEKRWIPALDEPEIVFPQYAAKLREYLADAS